jgi:hypothetical protein
VKIQPVDHLVAAVLTGDRERLQRLVGRDPGLGHQRNMFGVSPIHAAHFAGRSDLVAILRLPGRTDSFFLSAELGEIPGLEMDLAATARSGPRQGEVPAETARSQGHLVLASRLDPDDGADG